MDTTYDALGNKASVSNSHRSSSSSTDGTTTYNYDALGRVTLVTEPDGSKIATSYSGNTTTVTDEAGIQRKTATDAFGRFTSVWEQPGGVNYQTAYQYDVLDNLTCVEQHGTATGQSGCSSPSSSDSTSAWRVRRFNYDGLSRLVSTSSPESGSISYTYDANGNLLTKTAPQANQTGTATTTITYCYDQLNRLYAKAYPGQSCASPGISYYYDQSSYNGLSITNGIGRRTGMSDASGATAWTYDPVGRVLKEQRTLNGITKSTSYAYNFDGSVATLTYPDGMVLNYTYNGAARPTSAYYTDIDPSNDINYVSGARYAPTGALTDALFGSVQGGFAGITGKLSFNNRFQPIQIIYTTGSLPSSVTGTACPTTIGTIMHRAYNFNAGTSDNGNVLSIANCRDTNRTQNFFYDSLNRITQAYSSGPNWGETFSIDAWGNLTNKGSVSGKTGTEILNAAPASLKNQLNGFSYDAAGDLINDGVNTYTYDAENRIGSVAGMTYTYDGDGNRVEKSNGKLYWLGSDDKVLAESDLSGNLTEEYIFFNGQRVARHDLTASSFNSFVQVNSATASSAQTVSVPFPSNETAGDMNIVVVGWNDTTSSVTSVTDSNNGGGSSNGTATLVQKVANTGCASTSTTCSVTVSATGAGHLLVMSVAWPANLSVSSVSGGGTWVCPPATLAADGTSLGSEMCYVLSSTSGATTITVTSSAAPGSGIWVIEFREYAPTATVSLDTAGNVDDGANCTSCSGVPLTLTGSNDLVVQLMSPGYTVSAVSAGWGDTDFPGPNYIGVADQIGASSGAAPTWTTASGHATGSALAFNLGTTTGGSTYALAVGPTTVGSGVLGGAISQSIYYLPNIKGGANTVTVTFNQAASYADVRVLEYSGLDTTSPLDVTAAASGSSTSASSGSATTSAADELIFGADTVYTTTKSAGSGFASRVITHYGDIAEDEDVSSAGSYSATATLNSSGNWVMQMATFEAAGGAAANVHYYFADHLGSTSVITDSTGSTIQQESDYYPYGGEIPVTGGDTNTYKFTGKERDSETGLDYFGARYYASNQARFITPDEPLVDEQQSDPQSWNLYTYVRNNPLSNIDLTGHKCLPYGTVVPGHNDQAGYGQASWLIAGTCEEIGNGCTAQWMGSEDTINCTPLDSLNPFAQAVFSQPVLTYARNTVNNYIAPPLLTFLSFAVPGALEAAGPETTSLGISGGVETGDTVVIGKMADLEKGVQPGERTLDLPNQGNPKANWAQNSSRLREAMREGEPIRDVSAGNPGSNTGFLRAERALLQDRGWTLKGEYWVPPSH